MATAAVCTDPTLKPIQRWKTIQSRSRGTLFFTSVSSGLTFDLCRSIFINKPLLILCRHIIKELIATERIYVDELLSVLLVSLQMFVGFFFCCCIFQLLLTAFFSPSSPLLRATGQKWKTRPCLTSFPQLCAVRKTFCLATCLRFTSFTAGKTRNQHTCKCCCVFFCGKVT